MPRSAWQHYDELCADLPKLLHSLEHEFYNKCLSYRIPKETRPGLWPYIEILNYSHAQRKGHKTWFCREQQWVTATAQMGWEEGRLSQSLGHVVAVDSWALDLTISWSTIRTTTWQGHHECERCHICQSSEQCQAQKESSKTVSVAKSGATWSHGGRWQKSPSTGLATAGLCSLLGNLRAILPFFFFYNGLMEM